MKDTNYVWGAAALVILIGIYTHTPYIKNFIRKINSQGQGKGYYYQSRGSERQDWGTGNFPQGFYEPITEEKYPSHIIDEYLPPHTLPVSHPNQHLCTGECKSGTCDSQGFCIDSGCGSVIRGESHCEEEKKYKSKSKSKTKEKGHRNTIPRYNGVLPDIVIPALQSSPDYSQEEQQGPSGSSYYLNGLWDNQSCKPAGSGHYMSCRRQGPVRNPTGSYRLDVDVTNFDDNFHDMEITSGGPGSSDGCCCGVTLGVHGPTGDGAGYVYAKTEDWGPQGGKKHGYAKYLCDDSGKNHVGPCNNPPKKANTSGKVHLMWQVQNVNGGAKYTGSVNGVPIDNPVLFNPKSFDGKPILPGRPNGQCRKQPNDPTRVRVDGVGKNVTFNSGRGLMVTPLS